MYIHMCVQVVIFGICRFDVTVHYNLCLSILLHGLCVHPIFH